MVTSLCMMAIVQLVEGQVVATNFGVESTVPSFTVIVGADGFVKNEPHYPGLGLVCS